MDKSYRFIFENQRVRGEIVFLSDTYQTILKQRNYPSPVAKLLGEAMVATALLSGTIKYEGQLILQIQGGKELSLLVVQSDQNLTMRALAKWQDDALFQQPLLESGQIAVTLMNQQQSRPYQGIIAVTSAHLNQNIENYFEQSEQLPTRLFLVANETQAAGILLQKMPHSDGGEMESSKDWIFWGHVTTLLASLKPEELLTLEPSVLLHRLYHEEDIRLFEPRTIAFGCRCSEERMWSALKLMDQEEIHSILDANPYIDVTCDFCNQVYLFSKEAVEEKLTADEQGDNHG